MVRRSHAQHSNIPTFRNSRGDSLCSLSAVWVVRSNFFSPIQCVLLRLSPQQTSSQSVCSQSPASLQAVKRTASTQHTSGHSFQSKSFSRRTCVLLFGAWNYSRTAKHNDEIHTHKNMIGCVVKMYTKCIQDSLDLRCVGTRSIKRF